MDEHIDDGVSILLKELLEHRKKRQVKEADTIKMILWNVHSIQVFYRRDGTIGWKKVLVLEGEKAETSLPAKKIVWSNVLHVGQKNHLSTASCSAYRNNIPLIIATVDSPHYRARLMDTMHSLAHHDSHNDGTRFAPITTVDMLNLSDNPSIGSRRILYEGWPTMISKLQPNSTNQYIQP